MSLNGIESSSGELVATEYNGSATSEAIVQGGAETDFVTIKNIIAKYKFSNTAYYTISQNLFETMSPLENGDELVVVSDDSICYSIVAANVIITTPVNILTSTDPFGDGSLHAKFLFDGNGNDELGTYTATIHGGGIFETTGGKFGGYSHCSTRNKYVLIDNLGAWFAGRDEFSVSFFSKPIDNSSGTFYSFCISLATDVDPYVAFAIRHSIAGVYVYLNDNDTYCSKAQSGSERKHIVVTLKDSVLKVYVDKEVFVNTRRQTTPVTLDTHNQASFGRIPANNEEPNSCSSYIDQFEVYTKELSALEVIGLFDAQKIEPQKMDMLQYGIIDGEIPSRVFRVDNKLSFGDIGELVNAIPNNHNYTFEEIRNLTSTNPSMSSNNTPLGDTFGDTANGASYEQWKAFETSWDYFEPASQSCPTEVGYQYEKPVRNTYYTMKAADGAGEVDHHPRSWEIYGSSNGVDFVLLDTQTDELGWSVNEYRYYSFYNLVEYVYYKIKVIETVVLGLSPYVTYLGFYKHEDVLSDEKSFDTVLFDENTRSFNTKVEIAEVDCACTEISADIWKLP